MSRKICEKKAKTLKTLQVLKAKKGLLSAVMSLFFIVTKHGHIHMYLKWGFWGGGGETPLHKFHLE